MLHYQPIVALTSGRITRVEALVRWAHPTRGLLGPLAFVPLAEEQGMIGPIGRWVLQEACRQARCLQDQFPATPPLSMHVNLSGRQLQQADLIAEDVALAHAIVNLSHTLNLHTIAEGIELPEQAAHLATLGCQDGQGYHFARPLAPEAMTGLLEQTLAPGGFLLRPAEAVASS